LDDDCGALHHHPFGQCKCTGAAPTKAQVDAINAKANMNRAAIKARKECLDGLCGKKTKKGGKVTITATSTKKPRRRRTARGPSLNSVALRLGAMQLLGHDVVADENSDAVVNGGGSDSPTRRGCEKGYNERVKHAFFGNSRGLKWERICEPTFATRMAEREAIRNAGRPPEPTNPTNLVPSMVQIDQPYTKAGNRTPAKLIGGIGGGVLAGAGLGLGLSMGLYREKFDIAPGKVESRRNDGVVAASTISGAVVGGLIGTLVVFLVTDGDTEAIKKVWAPNPNYYQ